MIVLYVFKNTLEILHMYMTKLSFNAHHVNFDEMVRSDKSFFKRNTKTGKCLQTSTGPATGDVRILLPC